LSQPFEEGVVGVDSGITPRIVSLADEANLQEEGDFPNSISEYLGLAIHNIFKVHVIDEGF
jgi:hypothetical protein